MQGSTIAPTIPSHDELPPHAVEAEEVAARLGTGPDGLSEADAADRRAAYGPNTIEDDQGSRWLPILLHQFTSPLIYLLLAAVGVTIALGEWVDAAAIAFVLALNTAIGFGQEFRAERSVRALMQLAAPRARVVRDGQEQEVAAGELVPGDVVLLESGSRVPADLRLAATTSLQIDESLLTGESQPATKQTQPVAADVVVADRTCTAALGTTVVRGRGRGYVVATGAATELGRIAEQVREQGPARTPLQERMDRLANLIAAAVGVAALAAFAIGAIRGEPMTDMLLVAVALAVAVVPEGLPVVFTVALALGVRRMAAHRAIVRRLAAVETLGSTTVIGSDKTGTLTENRMTVHGIWTAGREGSGGPLPPEQAGELLREGDDAFRWTLLAGVLASEAQLYRTDGELRTQGDPTEVALLLAADRAGLDPGRARALHELFLQVPFESDRRYSAAVVEVDGRPVLLVKGAPEQLLSMSARQHGPLGPDALDREEVQAAATDMAGQGLRVLAMGYRLLDRVPDRPEELPLDGLVLAGLQAMADPPRPGVKEAIAGCHTAGIRVVMITGDHAHTARAIARELGIAGDSDRVLTGRELSHLDDAELAAIVDEVAVYARVAPEHKHRIVTALQASGHTVAVTGDGVNDAPALKAADIGVAMGRSGTDVAREASDMVLTDDDFTSIFRAVHHGRVTFDNIRKATFFLVSTGAAAIVTLLTALVAGRPTPFVAAQLLWLNLVTNGVQDVALAFEPAEKGVVERPPRDRREGILTGVLWRRVAVTGLVMGIITLVLFTWSLDRSGSLVQARSVALTTMVVAQAYHVFNSRALSRSVFRTNPLTNRLLLGAQLTALAVHVAALYLPATQAILRVEPIDAASWLRIIVAGLAVIAVNEAHKWRQRRRGSATPPASGPTQARSETS